MLIRTKGNLIDMAENGEFDVIVHGCNCYNTMGSGIAKEIKNRYPDAYLADTSYTNMSPCPISKLGTYSMAVVEGDIDANNFLIINAYTQIHYLPRGVDHFEYSSFYVILQKLAEANRIRGGESKFGFPYIGMGFAGGDKDRIISMLEDFAKEVTADGGSVTLVEYEG